MTQYEVNSAFYRGMVYIMKVAMIIAAILGWISNIFKIVEMVADPVTGMFIVRIIGVILFPLGIVLGFV